MFQLSDVIWRVPDASILTLPVISAMPEEAISRKARSVAPHSGKVPRTVCEAAKERLERSVDLFCTTIACIYRLDTCC